MSFLLKFKFNY